MWTFSSGKWASDLRSRDETDWGGLEAWQPRGALLTGECEVGVSLISSTLKRLAPVCLSATSISVCFISACQLLSGPSPHPPKPQTPHRCCCWKTAKLTEPINIFQSDPDLENLLISCCTWEILLIFSSVSVKQCLISWGGHLGLSWV